MIHRLVRRTDYVEVGPLAPGSARVEYPVHNVCKAQLATSALWSKTSATLVVAHSAHDEITQVRSLHQLLNKLKD